LAKGMRSMSTRIMGLGEAKMSTNAKERKRDVARERSKRSGGGHRKMDGTSQIGQATGQRQGGKMRERKSQILENTGTKPHRGCASPRTNHTRG